VGLPAVLRGTGELRTLNLYSTPDKTNWHNLEQLFISKPSPILYIP